jgi:hypothetical protein
MRVCNASLAAASPAAPAPITMTSGIFDMRICFNGRGTRDRYSTAERVDLEVSLLKNRDHL